MCIRDRTTGVLLIVGRVISGGAILTNCSTNQCGQSRVHGKPISLLPIGVLVLSTWSYQSILNFSLFSSIFPPLNTQWWYWPRPYCRPSSLWGSHLSIKYSTRVATLWPEHYFLFEHRSSIKSTQCKEWVKWNVQICFIFYQFIPLAGLPFNSMFP